MPQNTLGGGGVTIGNPQAQQDYTSELARALADMQAAQQMGQQADALSSPQYAQNSGALGSLAMIAQAYAGKKLSGRASQDEASARERYYKGEAAKKDAEAQREAARKQAEIDKKLEIIRSGDKAMAAAYGVEMPKEEQYKPDWRERRKSDGSTELVDVNAIQGFDGQGGGSMVMDNAYRDAIAGIESAGSGDYGALGPATKGGDRAYGRYQVMGANIPEWTQAALGRPMTPQEFLQNPEAQDAVFDHRFGSYVQKYGPEGAAKAWFAGEGGMKNPNARDVLGTSVEDYGRKFTQNMGGRSIQWDAPQAGEQKLSTVQKRQQDIAEMKASGVQVDDMMAQEYIKTGAFPKSSAQVPQLSAGEAAAVRKQHKELKDALGAFKAFDQAVNETGNLVTAQFSAEERGRLGTAYNNARSYLRVLYNTGVLQPGELPMLEKALRDPTGAAAYDPRTRGEIQAQLGELYKLTERTFDNLVENYPQLYDAEKYRAVKAGQSAPPSGDMSQPQQSNRIRIKI